jgi:DNA primase
VYKEENNVDKYESIRSLPFPTLAAALGLDLARFRRRKEDWQGYCPVHNSKTNNNCFAYHDSGKFHCFSCDAKGAGAIDLAKLVKNIGFQAAVELLQGISPNEQEKPHLEAPVTCDGVLKPFTGKYEKFAKPCAWLESRIPDMAVRDRYGCFYYENNARKSSVNGHVLIPIRDIEGVLYGYLARNSAEVTADRPKYRWPANLPKNRFVFGAYQLKQMCNIPVKVVWLVESPFAAMKLCSFGLPALALYGWAVSDEQLSILQQVARGCVYIPDRNKRAEGIAQCGRIAAALWVKAPQLPEGVEDPEQLTKEQILAL